MNWSALADLLGIISFPLGLIAFFQARSVKKILRERSIDHWIQAQFVELKKLKKSSSITPTARRDINTLLRNLTDFYVSGMPWRDSEAKKLIQKIRDSLQHQNIIEKIPEDLDALHSVLFTTTRV